MSIMEGLKRTKAAAPPITPASAPIVVVGAGPAGMRAAEELIRRKPDTSVIVFGDERWRPYNRVRLTPLMVGEIGLADVYFPELKPAAGQKVETIHRRIIAIDRAAKTVTDAAGETHPYSHLVLATGSRPHVPSIPGIDKRNVFTFRDLDDAEKLLARVTSSRKVVVLGGGLLGLEAARGMHGRGVETVVVEHERHLMPRQLNDRAAGLLADHIHGLGIDLITGDGVAEVLGEAAVEGVRLVGGREIACDTLVVCTGIRPNIELARQAELAVGRGIRVDDQMRTSDPDIFAVGECAEHRGKIYGLMAPGLEQAAIAAHTVAGGKATYAGSIAATRLKVVGIPIFNVGTIEESEQNPDFRHADHVDEKTGEYRQLILYRGRLKGAIAVGEWSDMSRVQESVMSGRRLFPWQLRRFRREGTPWPAAPQASIGAWPATAIVCNCTGVTRGCLSEAVASGCADVEGLQRATGASTVCGTCRPLLQDLLGTPAAASAIRGWTWVLAVSALALLTAALFALLPPVPYRETVQAKYQLDLLWTDGTFKQISGFTLLGLSAIVALLSLRKRIRRFTFGNFAHWRLVHVALGLLLLGVLFIHTGFHLGHNINRATMLTFLAIALAGGIAGGAVAVEHFLGRNAGAAIRKWSIWTHIVVLWPLLTVLTFHVLAVYYF